MVRDIKERTLDFAVRIVELSSMMPRTNAGFVLGKQVLRSGTSIGANIEEATAAFSKDDFVYKLNTALKEARETQYWLRIIERSTLINGGKLGWLMCETQEIMNILGAIVSKAKLKRR